MINQIPCEQGSWLTKKVVWSGLCCFKVHLWDVSKHVFSFCSRLLYLENRTVSGLRLRYIWEIWTLSSSKSCSGFKKQPSKLFIF